MNITMVLSQSLVWKIISWPVSYVSQVIKSHFCSISHLTPCLTCTSVFSSLEYPTELRVISWVVLSQWILKVFSWGSDKTMSGVRELGHHAWSHAGQKGGSSVSTRASFSPCMASCFPSPSLLTDPETTIWTPWPFPTASVEADVIPAPQPGHPPQERGASVLQESRLVLKLAAPLHPQALPIANGAWAWGWAAWWLCKSRLSEWQVSTRHRGLFPVRWSS